MGEREVEQTQGAVVALLDEDLSPAYRVLDHEPQIDFLALDADADEEVFQVIARRQPTAVDLRIVLALGRIAAEAERAGDKAVRTRSAPLICAKRKSSSQAPSPRRSGDSTRSPAAPSSARSPQWPNSTSSWQSGQRISARRRRATRRFLLRPIARLPSPTSTLLSHPAPGICEGDLGTLRIVTLELGRYYPGHDSSRSGMFGTASPFGTDISMCSICPL